MTAQPRRGGGCNRKYEKTPTVLEGRGRREDRGAKRRGYTHPNKSGDEWEHAPEAGWRIEETLPQREGRSLAKAREGERWQGSDVR